MNIIKNQRTTYICALLAAVIASLGLATVRVLALTLEFDADAGYYDVGATLPSAFVWGTVVAVLIAMLFSILMRRDIGGLELNSDTASVIFVSALLGFVIIGGSIYGLATGTFIEHAPGISRTLAIANAVLSLPAAIYFLLGLAMPMRSKDGQVILSILMILWMFSKIIMEYFRGGVEINNPNRGVLLVALSVTLIFFVSECRFRTGTQRPAFFLFTGFASLLLLGLYALPNAVLILLRAYPDTTDVIRDLTMLCLFIYVLVRMCMLTSAMTSPADGDETEGYNYNGYDGGEGRDNGEYYENEGENAAQNRSCDNYGAPAPAPVSRRRFIFDEYDNGRYGETDADADDNENADENNGDGGYYYDEGEGDVGEYYDGADANTDSEETDTNAGADNDNNDNNGDNGGNDNGGEPHDPNDPFYF